MAFRITDGKGRGNEVAVDNRQRLLVAALIETESNFYTLEGLKFNINTGNITLTSAAKTSVLYLKNNDDRDLYVDSLIYNIGNSTNGAGQFYVDIIRNPTAGDIITNANDVDIGTTSNANLNFGSSNTLDADIYKGATGETVLSGGGEILKTINKNPADRIIIDPAGGFILPKGSTFGINYTPPVGNTTQIVEFAINVHVRGEDLRGT